jgi:response regulator RpfG family c-di-GMP phosphodiesterase
MKLGLVNLKAERSPIAVFLLDDDRRRHRWFSKRFDGDELDIAENVEEAKELLAENNYDAIFLDHDLLPHHYESNDHDDFARTGYAIAEWLHENKNIQRSATFFVHTRNADGGYKMVEKLRDSGRQVEYVPFPMLEAKLKTYWK